MKIRLIKEISEHQRRWRNDSRISKWTRGSELLSEEDQEKWLTKIHQDSSIQMFGIELSEDSKIKGMVKRPTNIGTAGLTGILPIHRTAEFSLLIGPEYQKKGYGRLALTELLNYGFKNLDLRVIYGETFEGNPAWKMFKDLGFTETGKHRKRYYKFGDYVDAICFDLLKDEWLKRS